ncbi:MAG: glycerol dehydrogenase, partial [Deltaproteobacteria bacterium]|nr:glycerol dehydrogenase [Deltaproteobacteria bacterium]
GGKTALSQVQERIIPGMESLGMKHSFSVFTGKGTKKNASDLAAEAEKCGADIIAGIGGGLVIDTAKAVAHQTGLPLVIVPTIASTDAPCSSVALQYTEDHVIDDIVILKRNPDLVLVDTRIIAEAPTRFFIAGMGDALSTWFEASTCEKTGAKNLAGARPTASGMAIARLTYDTLMQYGESAKMAVDLNTVTPAVDLVIEANCLLSSIGFENCGLGAAHSFGIGVGALKGTEGRLHGELVGFGVIANLIIENYPKEEVDKIVKFCISAGLPVTLDELGVEDQSMKNIKKAGKACFGPGSNMQNLAFDVTGDLAADIIIAADALGRKYKG